MTNPRAKDASVFESFADLLAYPRGDVAEGARQCLSLLEPGDPAARPLKRFAAWAERARPAEIEEVYSATFDLSPVCPPYVGHYICPDPARRNLFLGALAAVYGGEGFEPREELADHVAEVLRFLSVARDAEVRLELLRDGLLPALGRMQASFEDAGSPYRALIEAVLAYVSRRARKRAGREEARP